MVSYGMCLQVEAHHYCGHLNEEVRQCIIYDSAEPKARLIGIEYIISRRLFESLPEEEKKMWHSHQYEASTALVPQTHHIVASTSLLPESFQKKNPSHNKAEMALVELVGQHCGMSTGLSTSMSGSCV